MPDPDPTKNNATPTVLPDQYNDAMVSVTLAGQDKQVSLTELRDRYQKEHVAETRFREAHEVKAAAESALDVAADLRQGFTDRDSTKIRRAFRNSGLSDEDCDSIFAGGAGSPGAGDTVPPGAEAYGDNNPGVAETDSDERVVELQDAMMGLQKQIQELQDDKKQSTENKKQASILREVNTALDNDPELGQRLGELDAGDQQEFREMAYKLVAKASKTTPWGPRAIQEGLKLLKARKALWGGSGTRGSGDGTPGAPPGFGPSGHSASQIHQTTGTKPVSVYDKGYAANLLQRLSEKMGRK